MKTKSYVFLLFTFLGFSCKDKNAVADCGCESSVIKVLDNVKASYMGSNNLRLQLRSTDDVVYDELYQLCSKTDSLTITPDFKNPNYTVSGKVKNSCFSGPTLTVQAQLFEITEIKKTL
jgi:hypothetical protein